MIRSAFFSESPRFQTAHEKTPKFHTQARSFSLYVVCCIRFVFVSLALSLVITRYVVLRLRTFCRTAMSYYNVQPQRFHVVFWHAQYFVYSYSCHGDLCPNCGVASMNRRLIDVPGAVFSDVASMFAVLRAACARHFRSSSLIEC